MAMPNSCMKKNKNVLIAASGGLGDVIMEIPLLRRLKHEQGFESIAVAGTASKGGMEALNLESCIRHRFIIPDTSSRLKLFFSAFKTVLGNLGFFSSLDCIYIPLHSLDYPAFWFFFFLRGLLPFQKFKAQFFKPSFLTRFFFADCMPYDRRKHDIENHFHLGAFDLFDFEKDQMLYCKKSEKKSRSFLFQVGAGRGSSLKNLPLSTLAAIINSFAEKFPELERILIGSKSEEHLVEPLQKMLKAPVQDLVGKTTIPELIAEMKNTNGIFCYDSGVMHLASWLGLPVFAVFGPTDPNRNGPLDYAKGTIYRQQYPECLNPCHLPDGQECPIEMKCLSEANLKNLKENFFKHIMR